MSFQQQTIENYLSALGSKNDVPGGGSASALVGALGVSAGLMSAYFTTDEKKFANVLPEIKKIIDDLTHIKNQLQQNIDDDAIAFAKFSEVYAMPKNTDAEKKARTTAMQNAFKNAMNVPLQVMRSALTALEKLPRLAEIGNRNLITDTGTAALLLQATISCARLNILINAKYLTDDELKKHTLNEVEKTIQHANKIVMSTMEFVNYSIETV